MQSDESLARTVGSLEPKMAIGGAPCLLLEGMLSYPCHIPSSAKQRKHGSESQRAAAGALGQLSSP